MRKSLGCLVALVGTVVGPRASLAENAASNMGVGPISRGMGGTGVANPQGGDSGVYVNPGAMIFVSRMDFGATLLRESITATTTAGTAEGQDGVSPRPAVGAVLHPIEKFVMGFAMVEGGGAATDYRGTPLHGDPATTGLSLQRMTINQLDFVMAGGLKLMDEKLGVGMSIPISYQTIEMNQNGGGSADGTETGFGVTAKLGAAYQWNDLLRAGIYFKAPPLRAAKFSTNGLGKLAPPMELGVGASLISVERLVVSADVRGLFWDSAEGYGKNDRLDWKNQLVVAAGAQYGNADQPLMNWFIVRGGYNYGSNVVRDAFLLEVPALVQHHLTLGLSVDIGLSMHLNLGTVYGLKASRRDAAGRSVEASMLSLDFGMSGIFG